MQLGDFCWRVHDFESKDIPKLPDLKHSSMIGDNRILVINLPEGLSRKKPGQLSGDFVAYDLFKLEIVWVAKNAERIFFASNVRHELEEGMEDGSKLNTD